MRVAFLATTPAARAACTARRVGARSAGSAQAATEGDRVGRTLIADNFQLGTSDLSQESAQATGSQG
jgi:hypothetical protein